MSKKIIEMVQQAEENASVIKKNALAKAKEMVSDTREETQKMLEETKEAAEKAKKKAISDGENQKSESVLKIKDSFNVQADDSLNIAKENLSKAVDYIVGGITR